MSGTDAGFVAIFLRVWDATLKKRKRKRGEGIGKRRRKERKRKEEGIETIQLIIQYPSSEIDVGILVLHDGLFIHALLSPSRVAKSLTG
jgi:hypothetical protein